MHDGCNYVTNVKKFFELADSIMKDKLGFERSASGIKPTDTSYHIYKKSLIDYNLEITYTVVDYDDPDKIKECMIEMKFMPLSRNKDKNGGPTDKGGTYTITGFKIVGAKDDNLIIEPFGDKQEFAIGDKITKERTINDLSELDKSKQYLLPLDKEQLDKAIIPKNPFMEYKKSLLGLGCITGDEKSCCGCCYW